MGKNRTKSAANSLHEMLVQYDLGFKFDAHDLEAIAVSFGHDYGLSAITGFLVRATNKGMIKKVGTHKPAGVSRTRAVYELIDKIEWAFKAQGIGSYPGRNIAGNGRGQEELPLISYTYPDGGVMGHFNETSISNFIDAISKANGMTPKEVIMHIHDTDIPSDGSPVVEPSEEVIEVEDHPITVGPMITPTQVSDMIGYPIIEPEEEEEAKPELEWNDIPISRQINTIGSMLIEIASKVKIMENKPDKSLADFETNDLIEELRKRVK